MELIQNTLVLADSRTAAYRTTTLIPFLRETEEYLAFKYQKSRLQMLDMKVKRIMYF